ncbi:30S ribosomal protein S18 [Candidatus Woesebacteria bacterium RIFCSPHIGHO2_02_FULL_38_9]|uniref:Small ribosomal subunit protein bS18 n=1 Tax=Candidatus Woesebacteria bacterium RIFCSPHIGHO2_01_FULL_39_28 TaxID=1802496 RepID=A0A1F7YEM8_9BACT|nr:MAG: 30S ribosomal protein S18 [Candidatus Woesebacteria bacterium RIFCSPHIGHO2_01_FULL_39_28]OGM32264.1 MAG: 30S ribosomal protein S18 [Candidatus Woesebacteria bacterium RIFCSPHIGHO2_02_FULL_38_9]OGM56865.1 MAG: 30S ribosomal protein S18 [Candidatus Woesebacteria bacterium RIFCSPLOWO2_01_FULL_38_20]
MRTKVQRISKTRSARSVNCYYCERPEDVGGPSYKNVDDINRYLSDRARIVGRDRSGLCAKHQRRLAVAIKRARYLGLLPFKVAI